MFCCTGRGPGYTRSVGSQSPPLLRGEGDFGLGFSITGQPAGAVHVTGHRRRLGADGEAPYGLPLGGLSATPCRRSISRTPSKDSPSSRATWRMLLPAAYSSRALPCNSAWSL